MQAAPTRVVVLNDASNAKGGATGLAILSVNLFRDRQIPVTVMVGDDGDNVIFSDRGVEVVAFGERRLLEAGMGAALLRGLYNPRSRRVVGDWIRRHDDPGTVYHLHTWSKILSPSVFEALAPVRDRLFITAHDFFLVCPNGAYALFGRGETCPHVPLGARCLATACDRRNYGHKLWRVARQAVQAAALRYRTGGPHVLAIHAGMRPLLLRGGVPETAISVLPNPIQPWSSDRIPAETNAEFVFVGRLDQEKGPDLAAEAARGAGVPLRIIGDGPMLGRLQQNHPEVSFSGRQPPERVAALVRSARALVMPSRYPEPYGLVAGEALWSGLPVIVADQALLARSIVERGAGVAFDPRNLSTLAQAMAELARDDERTRRMSVRAFENTRDLGTTPDAWADALLAAYTRTLPSHRPRPYASAPLTA